GKNIDCVHLSDSTQERDCMLPGKGTFDMNPLIAELKNNSFNGPLTIEVYRNNYINYRELSDSLVLIEKLCNDNLR
ncbi:MAG TPA: sugar phosphate isomerase/epimerase, partial [Ruminiclostridium sp.]|nr:sugar phosphate isomerase/epimerase [Ruminiclostridium sp.]